MDNLKARWIRQVKAITGKFSMDGQRISHGTSGLFFMSAAGNCMATINAYENFVWKATGRVTPRGKAWLKVLENSIR